MDRREFLKKSALAAATVGAASVLPGCGTKNQAAEQPGEMTYRTNLHNGDKVSILGYGCMRWQMIDGPDGKQIIDQDSVNSLVDYALEHGVNYFDTSPVYLQGQSETATGIALARHPRSSYFLATKLSNFSNASRDNSILMYRKSMENLQTDYIDYYLLHAIGGGGVKEFNRRYVDNGMMDFLMDERQAGRIRNLGFSFHGNKESFDEFMKMHELYHWDFVQIQFNYVDYRHAGGRNTDGEYLYDELTRRNIPVVIMEPLLGGRLANVPEHIADSLLERNPRGTVASWAFRFAGTPSNILTVLSGMTYMEHLQDNLKTFSPLVPLTDDELAFLEHTAELMQTYPTIPCNNCQYCMPCPYGIDIPAILTHYNKCVNEGYVTAGNQDPNYRKARRAYLVSYDRLIEYERQANHCIGCNHCVSHCPQSIDIPKELRKIDRYVDKLRQGK
ncbi:MAG: aldo/keto reductase [Candidatus Cryptobacteroides sp.]